MRKLILAIAAVLLFGAACGDDDSLSAAGGGDFCDFNADISTGVDEVDISGDPGDLEAAFDNLLNNIDRAVDLAPDEIRDDVATLADAMEGFVDILAEYDYNMFAMGAAAEDDPRLAAMEDPAFEAAGDRVNEYCGFDDGDDDLSDDGGLGGDDGSDGGDDSGLDDAGDGIDPVELPDEVTDEVRAMMIQTYQSIFGWDEDLASCVIEELDLDDPNTIPDMTQFEDLNAEICGQPILELFATG